MPNTTAVPDLPALPELPKAAYPGTSANIPNAIPDLFRPDQMTAYGQACIAHYLATQPAPSGDAVEVMREALGVVSRHPMLPSDVINTCRIALSIAATSRAATVAKDSGEVDDMLQAVQKRVWAALDRRACPGVWMQLASDAIFGFKVDSYGNAIATPKPEASAANQQAGRDRNMGLLDEALHWIENSTENAPSLCGDIRKALGLPVAAPISEGTGKPTAADAGGLSLENAPIGTKAPAIMGGHWIRVELGWKWCTGATFPRPGGNWTGELIAPAAPAASNGDALPPKPEPCKQVLPLGWIRYTPDQMDAYVLADRTARAGTGSAGSIGKDVEYQRRLSELLVAENQAYTPAGRKKLAVLCCDFSAYIDRWANTRATKVEAAPGNAGEGTDEQRIETIEKFITDAKARGFEWDSMSFDTNATARAQLDARILATPKGPAA